jgi:hypothetical protein
VFVGSSSLDATASSTVAVDRDRGGDGFSSSRRQKRQPITKKQLYRIFGAKEEEETPPPPTPRKRKAVARRMVSEIEAGGLRGAARQEIQKFVRHELVQAYQPDMGWQELLAAVSRIVQQAEAEARRIEQEIEEEDEMILLLAA